ncbi:MAG: pyridoxamine 5'-phosphate oxidase [Deltaproteobacteria bacterium]|nr:pyridoxamine 5'-phosphate oxidase [Deltaproteobacteria bacterium]
MSEVDFVPEVLPEARIEPLAVVTRWIVEAAATGAPHPNSMVLATVGRDGRPDARVVLLKGVEGRSLVFYTNHESKKGMDLEALPFAAVVFHFPTLERQIRASGPVTWVDRPAAEDYFSSRPRGSQLGAWASAQSRPLESRFELTRRLSELEELYEGREVPTPPYWGGYRVEVRTLELWVGRPDRLHDRFRFELDGDAPVARRLSP